MFDRKGIGMALALPSALFIALGFLLRSRSCSPRASETRRASGSAISSPSSLTR